jgi:hypothetical protein
MVKLMDIHKPGTLQYVNIQNFKLESFGRGQPKLFVDHDNVMDFEVSNIHKLFNRIAYEL